MNLDVKNNSDSINNFLKAQQRESDNDSDFDDKKKAKKKGKSRKKGGKNHPPTKSEKNPPTTNGENPGTKREKNPGTEIVETIENCDTSNVNGNEDSIEKNTG